MKDADNKLTSAIKDVKSSLMPEASKTAFGDCIKRDKCELPTCKD